MKVSSSTASTEPTTLGVADSRSVVGGRTTTRSASSSSPLVNSSKDALARRASRIGSTMACSLGAASRSRKGTLRVHSAAGRATNTASAPRLPTRPATRISAASPRGSQRSGARLISGLSSMAKKAAITSGSIRLLAK